MNMKVFVLYALGFMGLQAANQLGQFPPCYPSAPAQQYQMAAAALQQLQLGAHESSTDCYRTAGSLPVQPQDRQPAKACELVRQRSLSENDAQKNTSLLAQIEQLPSLSQAPMQKLLAAALQLQQLTEVLVQAHQQSLQELESTPGTNTQVRQVAEQQLPKARKRVDESTEAIKRAIKELTTRLDKAKK